MMCWSKDEIEAWAARTGAIFLPIWRVC